MRDKNQDNDTSQQGYIKYDLSYDLQQIIEDLNKEIEKNFDAIEKYCYKLIEFTREIKERFLE